MSDHSPVIRNGCQPFDQVVGNRKSIRAFKSHPVSQQILKRVFELASEAPSNCNTQPWTVYLAGGETRDRLTKALLKDVAEGRWTPDIPYLMEEYPADFQKRQACHIGIQQRAFGVERDDHEARARLMHGNMTFWGAPHVAFFFMPAFGNEREAADIGMFAQTAMLACTALGLGSCPQTSLGLFAEPIKNCSAWKARSNYSLALRSAMKTMATQLRG